jgi:ribosomal protein S18 acetylase RimI-like enzyme
MNIEFHKANIPEEIDALLEFDRKVFASFPADLFDPEEWADYESYWMVADGKTVGCTAFMHDVDYDGGPRPKTLYIASTGVLPEFQGRGLGTKQKQWQIEYARKHGFEVMVTNMRESNIPSIKLNEKFGFKRRTLVPDYYSDPNRESPSYGTRALKTNLYPKSSTIAHPIQKLPVCVRFLRIVIACAHLFFHLLDGFC